MAKENLRFLQNLVKVCGDDKKKLGIVADVIKQSDKEATFELKYDNYGNPMTNDKGQAIVEKIGIFGNLTAPKLAQLVMEEKNNDDLFDENLSETEKRDRQAQQSVDRY